MQGRHRRRRRRQQLMRDLPRFFFYLTALDSDADSSAPSRLITCLSQHKTLSK